MKWCIVEALLTKTDEQEEAAAKTTTEGAPAMRTRQLDWLRSMAGSCWTICMALTLKKKLRPRLRVRPSESTPVRGKYPSLSWLVFRKELGRGAFGRVLLAEAKTDGKLYALKIVSKKNMRSSDKRQAKAERDILHAMTLKSPHLFTSGLKFAFQSENNLYLGMDCTLTPTTCLLPTPVCILLASTRH